MFAAITMNSYFFPLFSLIENGILIYSIKTIGTNVLTLDMNVCDYQFVFYEFRNSVSLVNIHSCSENICFSVDLTKTPTFVFWSYRVDLIFHLLSLSFHIHSFLIHFTFRWYSFGFCLIGFLYVCCAIEKVVTSYHWQQVN